MVLQMEIFPLAFVAMERMIELTALVTFPVLFLEERLSVFEIALLETSVKNEAKEDKTQNKDDQKRNAYSIKHGAPLYE